MTTTILLSALDPPVRAAILTTLDRSALREVLDLNTSDKKQLVDRIAQSDLLSSQIELTISHHNF